MGVHQKVYAPFKTVLYVLLHESNFSSNYTEMEVKSLSYSWTSNFWRNFLLSHVSKCHTRNKFFPAGCHTVDAFLREILNQFSFLVQGLCNSFTQQFCYKILSNQSSNSNSGRKSSSEKKSSA